MFQQLLDALNVKYYVSDKELKHIISSNDSMDSNFIFDVVYKGHRDGNLYTYLGKFYRIEKIECDDNIVFYMQDVTEIVLQYQTLKRDYLTKLYTRNVAIPMMEEYMTSADFNKEPYSFIMGDIDFFKKINDTYGHDAGDEILRKISMIMLNSFRTRDRVNFEGATDSRKNNLNHPKDILCRYGGEEFLIVVKNINLEETLIRVEELRQKIVTSTNVTMSFGVVNVTPEHEFIEDESLNGFVKIADNALYQSKHNGRNRISYFRDGEILEYNPDAKKLVKEKK